ncbi:hypothetical protein BDW75DRAFT_233669 [Aspergillus navahoensis]
MTPHRKSSFANSRSAVVDQARPSSPRGRKGQDHVDKIQRRRQQVLLAQRAYRARNEARTTALQQRVARLESALERAGQTIISFMDVLVGARVLASHQPIARRLRDTVKTCLRSAMEGNDCFGDVVGYSRPPEASPEQTHAHEEQEECPRSSGRAGLSVLSPARSPPLPLLPSVPPSDGAMTIEVPVFVNQLRIACLYHGLLLLKNPSVPLEALKRPFRLLLSLVPRETITSFFHACLHARLNNKQPDRCNDIPCFRLGGAGTHYPEVTVSSQNRTGSSPEQQGPPEVQVHNSLMAFSPEAHKDLGGEWFDLFDLVGYLQTQGIVLSTAPPVEDTAYRTVNAIAFTAALVEKGICLGHSPGFKQSDVEIAIEASSWK